MNKKREQVMALLKHYLKIYSIGLGIVAAFFTFLWITLVLFILSQTDPSQSELMMQRYLDIGFGLVAFASSLALVYGSFVESKTWVSVWTLGSFLVILGYWAFLFYKKYAILTPESLQSAQATLLTLTVLYVISIVPVLRYYRFLESTDSFLKPCKRSEESRWRYRQNTHHRFSNRKQRAHPHATRHQMPVSIEEDLFNPV